MTTVANFAVPFKKILDEEGKLCQPLPDFAKDGSALVTLYKVMVETRLFDKRAIALQRTGKMGTYAPVTGQEAIAAAIGHAMRKEDLFIPYYRDYAAQFQRGVKMAEILAYWGGDERGNDYSCKSQDLPIAVPIASQCLHAAGIAFAFKYRKEARVAVVCLGDGATSQGDFYEALNVAGAWKLPLVFVINNNYWAISVPLSKQTSCQTLAQKAIAGGFQGVQVDGNDIFALREVIGDAIEGARRGEGPCLIEALSYRLSDHTTADDASRYQPAEEVQKAHPKEPISRLKRYLEEQQLWSQAEEEALIKESQQKVQEAIDEYLNKEKQPITSIFDYLYQELPEYLLEQRAMAIEEASNA